MTTELYRKYRPTKISQLVGQSDMVKVLVDMGKRNAIPHCLLLTGPSGTGKTTTARIIAKKLGCGDHDLVEVNAAETRGIDMVRDISNHMRAVPISGKCRVWIVDEIHKTTSDAQSAFLKILEDTPDHVYFMLATTDPQKLKRTIITRSTELKLKALSHDDMFDLLRDVHGKEEKAGGFPLGMVGEVVLEKIAEVADGSARKALVLLHSVIGLEDEEEQLRVVEAGDASHDAIEIARALVTPAMTWHKMTKILGGIEGLEEDSEGIRRLVLSYMSSVALKNPKIASRACDVILLFQDPWFNCGRAGLIAACYELVSKK
jgi:DNA polymerase III gamma/tau subunit